MKKIRRILTLCFCGLGLIFMLAGAVVEIWLGAASEGMEPVTGVIEDVGLFRQGKPTVAYTVDGQTYRMYSSVSMPRFQAGGEYPLLVDLSNPARVVDPALHAMSVVFFCVGGVMMLVGAVCHVFLMHKERRLELLRSCGFRAEGAVTRVYQNHSVKFNRRSPWVVEAECLHPHTREKLTAKSPWLWETRLQPGDRVTIFIDPMTGKSMVDVEEA